MKNVVVERGDTYLVCKRPERKRHGGLWEFPGGKIQDGESTFDAIRRELREELSLEVTEVGETLQAFQDPGSPFISELIRET
jgi:8-oxo-dGTP diphosphatase